MQPGDPLEESGSPETQGSIQALTERCRRSEKRRADRCMTTEDLEERIGMVLSTTENPCRLGVARILLVLFLCMLAVAGARRMAVILLRFGHTRYHECGTPAEGR